MSDNGSQAAVLLLTVDSEIMGHSHVAHWVADSTLIGAVVGAVNRLYEHSPVVYGETDSAARMERPAILHPHSGADGARGLTAEVGGAFILYQNGCRAADGGSSYWRWQDLNSVSPIKRKRNKGRKNKEKVLKH